MIKKKITIDGFDGPEDREYYFHMTRAEALKWVKETKGTLPSELDRIASLPTDGDLTDLLEMVGRILHRSVGIREGSRFIKTQEIADDFVFSGALDVVLDDLMSNPEEVERFVGNIFPSNITQQLAKS